MIGGSRIAKLIAEISLGIGLVGCLDEAVSSPQDALELESVDYRGWLDTGLGRGMLSRYPSVSTKRNACIPPGYDDIRNRKSVFVQ
jgi:hypothetical protein